MDDDALRTVLDTRTGVGPEPLRRFEVLNGMAGRRRSWSLEQKLAILAEADHSDNLTAVARRHDIRTSQLYTWRRELRYALEAQHGPIGADPMFVPVVADSDGRADVAIEVELGGAVVRISGTARPDLAAAVVQALRATL